MNHALVLNSSERPGEDRTVKRLGSQRQLQRVGAGKINMAGKMTGTANCRSAQIIGMKINAKYLPMCTCVSPREPTVPATDLQYARCRCGGEICKAQ
jgi:hypothetical protein